MRKFFNNIEDINQFKKERTILKRNALMQDIIQIMNDQLSVEIYEDLNHSFRDNNDHVLYLDITSEIIEVPSKESGKNKTARKWIDVPNIQAYHSNRCSIKLSIEDLIFNDDHIIDTTGYKFYFNEINISKRFLMYYELISENKMKGFNNLSAKELHNLMNGTLRQTQVPTLMFNEYYCPDCQKWTKLTDSKNANFFDKTITCPKCGTEHHFDDIKFVNVFEDITIYSSVFMDKNKVTFSNKTLTYGLRTHSDDRPFWNFGTHKVTINLETGYSYRMLSGSELCMLKRAGINVPSFYNCTYENHRVGYALGNIAYNKALKLIDKYREHKNLVNLINRRFHSFKNIISKHVFVEVDDYMTNYYTNKFGYKVQPLIDEESRNTKAGNARFTVPAMQEFISKNRFINLNSNELYLIFALMDKTRDAKKYKLMNRTAPTVADIIVPYLKSNVSKKLRKDIIKLLNDNNVLKRYNNYQIIDLLLFISKFTNKEYQNTVFKTLTKIGERTYDSYHFLNLPYMTTRELDLLFKLRDEQYISKLSINDLHDKLEALTDCIRLIDEIQEVLGKDWNPLDLKFKTENQYHNDLIKILNSDTVREIRISKDNNPFEMEDEIYALEEPENNIHIARVGAELTVIGQQMGICVGGYINSVRNKHCRIAYVTDPVTKEYKVCLELRPEYKKNKQGQTVVTYSLAQAKLKRNELARNNEKYYQLLLDWTDRHNIKIETRDMIIPVQNMAAELIEF